MHILSYVQVYQRSHLSSEAPADPVNPYFWPEHGLTLLVLTPHGHLKYGRAFRTAKPGLADVFARSVADVSPGSVLVLLAAVRLSIPKRQ